MGARCMRTCFDVSVRHDATNPPSYGGFNKNDIKGEMERVMGIEPTLEAWEAAVLPLNYTRSGVVHVP